MRKWSCIHPCIRMDELCMNYCRSNHAAAILSVLHLINTGLEIGLDQIHQLYNCPFCIALLTFQASLLSVQRSNASKIMGFLTLQMKTPTALWTTGTATIEVKPVTASPLHTTVHHSPMPPYTSIPSATSTATPQVCLINAPATAKMWSITIRGPSGVCA